MESSVRLESEARFVWLQRFYSYQLSPGSNKEEVIE